MIFCSVCTRQAGASHSPQQNPFFILWVRQAGRPGRFAAGELCGEDALPGSWGLHLALTAVRVRASLSAVLVAVTRLPQVGNSSSEHPSLSPAIWEPLPVSSTTLICGWPLLSSQQFFQTATPFPPILLDVSGLGYACGGLSALTMSRLRTSHPLWYCTASRLGSSPLSAPSCEQAFWSSFSFLQGSALPQAGKSHPASTIPLVGLFCWPHAGLRL